MSDTCYGCGATLQYEHNTNIGYIPQKSYEEGDRLCKRCFRLKHYNETPSIHLDSKEYTSLISAIHNEDACVLYMVDILDLANSTISGLNKILGNKDVVLVANKRDLLPKSLKDQKLVQYLKKYMADEGIRVQDAVVISAEKQYNYNELIRVLEQYRRGRNVYVIGTTNTGKSTFINSLLREFNLVSSDVITTSNHAGTTLGFVKIPLDDTTYIIDTPGLMHTKQVSELVSVKTLKQVTPLKEIKQRVYQLKGEQTLFLGGFAYITLHDPMNAYVYASNTLPIHRAKAENTESLLQKLPIATIPYPVVEDAIFNETFKHYDFTVSSDTDIVISGIGFVSIKGNQKQYTIRVSIRASLHVSLRTSMI